MLPLRDALEAALIADPDDLATHRAYADYLQEQGDPRGEFIQIQIALEAHDRTDEDRRTLRAREQTLLARFGRGWLGRLADELLGPANAVGMERPESWPLFYEIRFVRGWLDRITLRRVPLMFGSFLGRLLCEAPEARLLRELVLPRDPGVVPFLVHSPYLGNLRVFSLGDRSAANIEPLIDLASVRDVLHSPNLPRLIHLQLRSSNLGDVGCTEIVTSSILKRLKILDLRNGDITDTGARILADCPDLRRLELLDIEDNALTQTGIDALRRVLGPRLQAANQHPIGELESRCYLSGRDFE